MSPIGLHELDYFFWKHSQISLPDSYVQKSHLFWMRLKRQKRNRRTYKREEARRKESKDGKSSYSSFCLVRTPTKSHVPSMEPCSHCFLKNINAYVGLGGFLSSDIWILTDRPWLPVGSPPVHGASPNVPVELVQYPFHRGHSPPGHFLTTHTSRFPGKKEQRQH